VLRELCRQVPALPVQDPNRLVGNFINGIKRMRFDATGGRV
jgi:hypothetical protein